MRENKKMRYNNRGKECHKGKNEGGEKGDQVKKKANYGWCCFL